MKLLLFFAFFINFLTAGAQDKNQFYALDGHMNQTVLDSSKYILWIHEKDSACWQWDYYYTWGSLVKSTDYADHDGTIKNGRFCLYNAFGNLDSTGVYKNGKRNGLFIKLRSVTKDSIQFVKRYDYEHDSLLSSTNLITDKANHPDTTREGESEFPGGPQEWLSYISHNLHYPERALNKNIEGRVKVYFLVDTEGHIKDPFILKSVEYSLDQESIKLIKNSGKWEPGQKNGIPMETFKIQPVNFTFDKQ